MRTQTVTTNIYTYDELSAAAKSNARDWYRAVDSGDTWSEDYRQSLAGFVDLIPYETRTDFEVAAFAYSYCKIDTDLPEAVQGLTGVHAWKWFRNNGFFDDKLLSGSCPFTGYCADEDLLDPIRKFRDKPDTGLSLIDVLDLCVSAWVSAWVADLEHQASDEGVEETILCNDYEFTETGDIA